MAVGVLALQGSFNEHIAALRRLGVKGVEIRKPQQLENISSLIIPGGERTTMAMLAEFHNLNRKLEGRNLLAAWIVLFTDCTSSYNLRLG